MVTLTTPVPAGVNTVHQVSLTQLWTGTVVLPNFTIIVSERLVPMRETVVPPIVGPTLGLTVVMEGPA
jgi:hypothetical protein